MILKPKNCLHMFFFFNEQPLRAWFSVCSTSIGQECIYTVYIKVHLVPLKYNIPFYPSSLPWKKTKLLNPTESGRQVQFPSPTPPDMEMVTFTPTLPSPPPQVWEFLFLVYCVASRQSLHVFPWKPFCLLSIFLHYLPLHCFSICLFSSPFLFHFLPPSLSPASPAVSLSHPRSLALSLCFSFPTVKNFSPPLFVINQGSERRHSVRGISRGADEISDAHLSALYGDLLGWDKQQASHHSQPNRLPACMCLFLLHCHDHCRCQGWSSPRRPAPW